MSDTKCETVHGVKLTRDDGWSQVIAGLSLIGCSQLAFWRPETLTLSPADEDGFEAHASTLHRKFGRLICWLTFGVGSEYLVRGAFMLKGYNPTEIKKRVRSPRDDADLQKWIPLALKKDGSVLEDDVEFTMHLGGDLPWGQLFYDKSDRDFVNAAIRLLATKMRNRDAHRYTENVRSFHFRLVRELFVPAFNKILSSVDREELREKTAPLERESHRVAPKAEQPK